MDAKPSQKIALFVFCAENSFASKCSVVVTIPKEKPFGMRLSVELAAAHSSASAHQVSILSAIAAALFGVLHI
jgi:hypothetical protein